MEYVERKIKLEAVAGINDDFVKHEAAKLSVLLLGLRLHVFFELIVHDGRDTFSFER